MYRFLDTKQSTINKKKNHILIVNTFLQSFMLKVMNVYIHTYIPTYILYLISRLGKRQPKG